jgi:hypothetical protein
MRKKEINFLIGVGLYTPADATGADVIASYLRRFRVLRNPPNAVFIPHVIRRIVRGSSFSLDPQLRSMNIPFFVSILPLYLSKNHFLPLYLFLTS